MVNTQEHNEPVAWMYMGEVTLAKPDPKWAHLCRPLYLAPKSTAQIEAAALRKAATAAEKMERNMAEHNQPALAEQSRQIKLAILALIPTEAAQVERDAKDAEPLLEALNEIKSLRKEHAVFPDSASREGWALRWADVLDIVDAAIASAKREG